MPIIELTSIQENQPKILSNPTTILTPSQTVSSPVAETQLFQLTESQSIEPKNKLLTIQPKLTIGSPDDPYEQEADSVANHIMRMPETNFAVQRKCGACEHEEEPIQRKPFNFTPDIQRKCSACEHEEEKIQKKPFDITPFIQKSGNDGGGTANETISSQIESRRGNGNLMDSSTRSFMENRFGNDFSGVKIHTDSNAVQLSQELNAQAFTVGNDVFFNQGKYNPESDSGKHLLAHELTHTVQQSGAIERKVQRRVSPQINSIRDHLTYGITDWVVTDGDVRSVLFYLQNLSPQDLRDTVIVLEREGLISRLYDNLAESSDRTLDNVPDLLQRIQDARFTGVNTSGTPVASSCDVRQRQLNQAALSHVVDWANHCIDAIIIFEIGIDPIESARIGRLLDKYFFHEAQAGILTETQRANYAREMITRLTRMKDGAPNTIMNCVSPFDLACAGDTAAYVTGGPHPVMRMCRSFFNYSANSQISMTFHELMHFYNRGPDGDVGDTGYRNERIFEYMPPDRSINNADSYSTFATEIMLGEKAASNQLRRVRDTVAGCTPEQEANLRRDIAYATRMIRNAINQIDDDYATQNSGGFAATHFHSTNHQDLIKFADRFHTVRKNIPNKIAFHCEVNSAKTTDNLPFVEGDGLHLTRGYFDILAENSRIDTLLAILFRKYSSGMNTTVWASAPGYGTQTLNQSYANPGAFVGYTRDITNNSDEWNFANAEVRYGEEIERTIQGVEGNFEEIYDDAAFRREVSDAVVTNIATEPTANAITNHAALANHTQAFRNRMAAAKIFLDRMYHDFSEQNTANFFAGLSAFKGQLFSENQLFLIFDYQYLLTLRRLNTSFRPILARINRNEAVTMLDWADYTTVLSDYRTESQQNLRIMRTYTPYLEQLHTIQENYATTRRTLITSPQVGNLSLDDYIDVAQQFSENKKDFQGEISDIQSAIRQAIRGKQNFDLRNPDLPNLTQLLRRFQKELREIATPTP